MRFFVIHQAGSVGYYIAMTAMVIAIVSSLVIVLGKFASIKEYSGDSVPQQPPRKVAELEKKEINALVRDTAILFAILFTLAFVLILVAKIFHSFI